MNEIIVLGYLKMKTKRCSHFQWSHLFCLLLLSVAFWSCNPEVNTIEKEKVQINLMLDQWNRAAAKADFEGYFKCFSEDGIFIGTDASEHWDKKSFMIWAKPHFDKGKTWNFTSLKRNIYFDQSRKIAWFDELLNTKMKICRGSGVLVKQENEWKIQQYVLSMTIPNSKTDSVVNLKSAIEDELIKSFTSK